MTSGEMAARSYLRNLAEALHDDCLGELSAESCEALSQAWAYLGIDPPGEWEYVLLDLPESEPIIS